MITDFDQGSARDIRYINALTVQIEIPAKQYQQANHILRKSHSDIKTISEQGTFFWSKQIFKRPILLFGVVMFLLAALWLPGRVFFVNVSGNSLIPNSQILAQAEKCGVSFGSKSKEIRSEQVKNELLTAIPELQWVGINTCGCVANIQVQERSLPDKNFIPENTVSSIVAASDSTVTELTVHRGTPLVEVGQSVNKGDVLISGYTDYGLKIVAQSAQAEIFGHTKRRNSFIVPFSTKQRIKFEKSHICYRLRIGKKVINFCNHSGIPDEVCVKMYSEDYLSLPGDFQLPVAFIKITCLYYSQSERVEDTGTVENWLPSFAKNYVLNQMVAGEILDENLQWYYSIDACQLLSEYACHEMIGQMKYEEIIEHHAEDN